MDIFKPDRQTDTKQSGYSNLTDRHRAEWIFKPDRQTERGAGMQLNRQAGLRPGRQTITELEKDKSKVSVVGLQTDIDHSGYSNLTDKQREEF